MNIQHKGFVFRPLAAILLAGVLLAVAGCNTAIMIRDTTAPTTLAGTTARPSSGPTDNAANHIQLVSPQQAQKMLAEEPRILLLDVRTAEEFAAGHIAGSRLLPYDEIKTRAGELPADRQTKIIVYCRSGRRSALAAADLAALGYQAIYDLGGIQDWPYPTVVR